MSEIDVTRYRFTVRGDSGETLAIVGGEVSTMAGKITLPMDFPRVGSIEIEWTREMPHNGHYGVSPEACPPWCGVGGPKCAGPQHEGHYGAAADPVETQWDSMAAMDDADERPMHYCSDDDRTACGKFAGMVYQYAATWEKVTCRECRAHHSADYGALPGDDGPQGCLEHLVNQLDCEMCTAIRKRYYDRLAAGDE